MIQGIFGPKWFAEVDILIDTLSFVVLLLIGYFSLKYYRINKNKKYLNLGISFLVLALSFIFLIAINAFFYYDIIDLTFETFLSINFTGVTLSNAFVYSTLLLYRLLTLFGLYFLFLIYRKQEKPNTYIIIYLILVSSLFSISTYYIFHLTSLLLLSLITYEYSKQYSKTRYPSTKLLMYSFGIISVSQIVSIFILFHIGFYVFSQFIQLLGYSLLLITFILVLKHGKKDKD